MPDFKSRSQDEELMDDLSCSGPVIDQTLRELDFINKWLGGDNISIGAFKKLMKDVNEPVTFLDLGCGGGDILISLAQWSRKHGKKVKFIGVDANPAIITYAKENCRAYPEISFQCLNILDPVFATLSCDILHCCLFTHHFSTEELEQLFRKFRNQAKLQVIINDLHRHPLAYFSIKWLTGTFSKSEMVKNDASLSVARGFSRAELLAILKGASIGQFDLKWRWAFRWRLTY